MFHKKMNDAINEQINAEFYSAYLYLAMATYFEGKNLPGFANWMRIQFQEEQFHALKMYDFVHQRGGTVILEAIEKPKAKFKNLLSVFEETLEHEKMITGKIEKLMDIAVELKDYATQSFLQWYIEEQVEEEASVEEILNQLKLVDGKGQAILMFDTQFATRTFVPPTV